MLQNCLKEYVRWTASSGPANKPELRNFSAMKSGYAVAALHARQHTMTMSSPGLKMLRMGLAGEAPKHSKSALCLSTERMVLQFVGSGVKMFCMQRVKPSDAPSSAVYETAQCGCPAFAFGVTFYATF